MNNKQLVSLFFGLGFLVLIAGLFTTTQNYPNIKNNTGVEPQTVNRSSNNNMPNAINENMPSNNESAEKIKTQLDQVDGVDNVDAVVANKCALISCNVSETLRNQDNFKTQLTNKIKNIDPTLVNVYIMENQDNLAESFNDISLKFTTLDTSSFNNFWNRLTGSNR